MPHFAGARRSPPFSPALAPLAAAATWGLLAAGLLVSGSLAAGRLANSENGSLSFLALVATAALAIAWRWAVGSGGLLQAAGAVRISPAMVAWAALPALGLLLLGVALVRPGNSPLGLGLLVALLVIAEALHWNAAWRAAAWRWWAKISIPFLPRPRVPGVSKPVATSALAHLGALAAGIPAESGARHGSEKQIAGDLPLLENNSPAAEFAGHEELANALDIDAPDADAATLLQQLTRWRLPAGGDSLTGSLWAEFAAGQRVARVHVPFCPPFAALPECSVEPGDGPEVDVRLAQLLPYGVRLDVSRRGSCAAAERVEIEFFASTNEATDA